MDQTTPSVFDYSSPFVEFCTQTTCDIFLCHFEPYAALYRTTLTAAIEKQTIANYADRKMIYVQQTIAEYALKYCQDYINISNMDPSVVNDDNNTMDNVYVTLNKIIANGKTDKFGYRHLNCILDAMRSYCFLQYKYVFKDLLQDVYIDTSDPNVDEKSAIKNYLRMLIKAGTAVISNQFQSTYSLLSCKEDDSCERDTNFELNHLIELNGAYKSYDSCTCGRHYETLSALLQTFIYKN